MIATTNRIAVRLLLTAPSAIASVGRNTAQGHGKNHPAADGEIPNGTK